MNKAEKFVKSQYPMAVCVKSQLSFSSKNEPPQHYVIPRYYEASHISPKHMIGSMCATENEAWISAAEHIVENIKTLRFK